MTEADPAPVDAAAAPRRRPRDRKATILRTAAELFGERGFAAVSVTDIATQVGITPGALYRHFPGKEALLDAVVLDAVDTFLTTSRAAFTPGPGDDPAAALEGLVASAVQVVLRRPAPYATYVREVHRVGRESRELLVTRDRALFAIWSEAVSAVRPQLATREIAARTQGALGALVAWAVRRPVPAPVDAAALCTAAIVSVFSAPPARQWAPTPRRARPWRPATSRRDEILAAAMALFRKRGYQGVGIDEIGAAAGIAGPTVYAHYASKSQILVDAFDWAAARVTAGVTDALARATSPPEALAMLARSYAVISSESVDLIVVTSRETHALPAEERRRQSRRRRDVREAWASVLREVRPELTEAEIGALVPAVFLLVNQVVQQARPGGPSVDAVAEMAVAFLGASYLPGRTSLSN